MKSLWRAKDLKASFAQHSSTNCIFGVQSGQLSSWPDWHYSGVVKEKKKKKRNYPDENMIVKSIEKIKLNVSHLIIVGVGGR